MDEIGRHTLPRIDRVFDLGCEIDASREALVGPRRRYTYEEVDLAADRAALFFQDLGVTAGDRIGASLPNSADGILAFHGAMRASGIWVGINQNLAGPEKAFILADSGASVLLCDEETTEQLVDLGPDLPNLKRIVVVGPSEDDDWNQALSSGTPSTRPRRKLGPTEPAGIAYTSGTTGFPKGVVHSERNLLVVGKALIESRKYGPDLRKGDCLAITILNLLILSTLLCAQAGGCCVITDRTDSKGLASWLRSERPNVWNGVPAMLYSLVNDESVQPEALTSLDEVWTGGSDCPVELQEGFQHRFGKRLTTTYGLTEAPAIVTISPRGEDFIRGSSGVPLPHQEVSIRDPDGRPVEANQEGEICIRPVTTGPFADIASTMLEYWQQESATEDVFAGGFLHTGDTGYLDEDRHLYVRGRLKSMIIRGSANIYPTEVERVLLMHPSIKGCVVLGMPDERLGQTVMAVVELEHGHNFDAQAVKDFCAESLARYKVPEMIIAVDQLPRNALGKVGLDEARQLLAGHLAR